MKRAPVLLGLAFFLGLVPWLARAETVDLELVLAADISDSINDDEFALQRQGYATALTDPKVIDSILSGPRKSIALTYLEWSDAAQQKVVVDWAVIRSAADAKAFADRILAAPRPFQGWTSISAAIDFGARHLKSSGVEADRHVIDLSGDGKNNSGRPVWMARDRAIADGVTINGLAIINASANPGLVSHVQPPEGLPEYYRGNVIGGRNSFLIVAEGAGSFADSLTRKLVIEIADLPPPFKEAAR